MLSDICNKQMIINGEKTLLESQGPFISDICQANLSEVVQKQCQQMN